MHRDSSSLPKPHCVPLFLSLFFMLFLNFNSSLSPSLLCDGQIWLGTPLFISGSFTKTQLPPPSSTFPFSIPSLTSFYSNFLHLSFTLHSKLFCLNKEVEIFATKEVNQTIQTKNKSDTTYGKTNLHTNFNHLL